MSSWDDGNFAYSSVLVAVCTAASATSCICGDKCSSSCSQLCPSSSGAWRGSACAGAGVQWRHEFCSAPWAPFAWTLRHSNATPLILEKSCARLMTARSPQQQQQQQLATTARRIIRLSNGSSSSKTATSSTEPTNSWLVIGRSHSLAR